jgi:hypothetical protein
MRIASLYNSNPDHLYSTYTKTTCLAYLTSIVVGLHMTVLLSSGYFNDSYVQMFKKKIRKKKH